jgi:hypothetical protein
MKISKHCLTALLLTSMIQAGSANFDASRRYGPNSPIYNTPLYFNARDGKKKLRKPTRKKQVQKPVSSSEVPLRQAQ